MPRVNETGQTGYNARVEQFRHVEYPMLDGSVYLDHAGTTLYPKSLVDQFAKELTSNLFGNPHAASAASQLSTSRIEDIRLRALRFFNADPADFDLVFVANATAAIKLVADALRAAPDGFDYVYHLASHTSLVGVREEARNSLCVDNHQMQAWTEGRCPLGDEAGNRPLLCAYPAQSNMDGRRYPLDWADRVRHWGRKTYTLLDAAALVCSAPLDLSNAETAPDFTALSFYKIFGLPDLGALIVRRNAENVFNAPRYFGGGTVDMVVCVKEQWHAPKTRFLHERLEDGTLPVHNIITLDAAIDVHARLFGSMQNVSAHTAFLGRRLYRGLASLRHANGEPVCELYSPDPDSTAGGLGSGPVIAFNIRNSQREWISLTEVEKLAVLKRFHIRTGGVCNPGGIAAALGLGPWEMKQNFSAGFRCGSENDIVAGKPTGVVRASLGAMSTMSDVDSFVNFIAEFYQETSLPSPALGPVSSQGPPNLRIHSLFVYPIKSCGSFEIPAGVDWEVRPEGLAWDREWCLVHQGTGQALSQKRYPAMALLRPSLDFERGELRVTYAGQIPAHLPRELSIPLSKNPALFHPPASRSRPSRVCGEDVQAQTYSSPEINSFFSNILGVPCSLARFPPGGRGPSMRHAKAHLQKHQVAPTEPEPRPPGSFPPSPPDSDSEKSRTRRILLSNESPILAITLPSVKALNEEMQRNRPGRAAVLPAVFRANMVLAPAADTASDHEAQIAPYAEDWWSSLRIGPRRHEFECLGACRRCHMVCINQETAEKSDEPFVTLSKTRRFDGKVFFGVHMCYGGQLQDTGQLPTAFFEAAARGDVRPLVIPWSFVGSFFLPLLYLSFPHTNRPWLYRLRWAVAATIVYFHVRMLQTTTASDEAVAYTTGLAAVWGTIWSLRLLVFTRPQWDAARIVCRLRRREKEGRRVNGVKKQEEKTQEDGILADMTVPDESVAAALAQGYEYVWQSYPADAPFFTRLGWSADLLTSFRGAGWNYAIPSIPHPPPPPPFSSPDSTCTTTTPLPVRLDQLPLTSRSGSSRSTTYATFRSSRFRQIALAYLVLDILVTVVRRDPYFVMGPEYPLHETRPPLVPGLYSSWLPASCSSQAWCGQFVMRTLRHFGALAGIISGLHFYTAIAQVGGLLHAAGGHTGVAHRMGLTPVHNPDDKQSRRRWEDPILFFLLQPVGALVQSILTRLIARIFPLTTTTTQTTRTLRRTTTFLFVLFWLHLTAPLLIDDMSRVGLWMFEPIPLSVLQLAVPQWREDPGSWWRWGKRWKPAPSLFLSAAQSSGGMGIGNWGWSLARGLWEGIWI
ncbi:hypothetical protein VTJ49DRAFT_2333 [Mycothermus thermophilus]|uniref:Molybdenum cofactor sulfurase n=1 Tax=Humicola insolens TaxID=85995 RepID=A0ABR3VRP0_HUMIN